ncbi:MAG TPA: FtsX-like permease family protein [Candidatus Cloacimonadota bacterium]|nr:FtsX-like permease family protein [Candidatus Cloacimonadota bacterium]
MMLLKLANRNILGNGKRSLINMVILAIVLVGMIWMMAMFHSWTFSAAQQMGEWEHGKGLLEQKDYDPYDSFSWDKSHAPLSRELMNAIAADEAVPILLSPAVIYPQGRMMSVQVRGIPADQKLLKLPTSALRDSSSGYAPALIGTMLAKNLRIKNGDTFTMRLKDASGAYDALDLQVVTVMKSPVPSVDGGAIWVDLERLQSVKTMPNEASIIVLGDPVLGSLADRDWKYLSVETLLADTYKLVETKKAGQFVMFGLFIFLAMLAIFDTQVLSLFMRRKEIGTLVALGMTQRKVIMLFTLEGLLYLVYAIGIGAVMGIPLFLYFALHGWSMPPEYDSFGIAGLSETLRFSYPPNLILSSLLIMLFTTWLASWLPTLRISRLKPTDALRGRGR